MLGKGSLDNGWEHRRLSLGRICFAAHMVALLHAMAATPRFELTKWLWSAWLQWLSLYALTEQRWSLYPGSASVMTGEGGLGFSVLSDGEKQLAVEEALA